MRVQFRATDSGFHADEYSIVCGINGRDAAGIEHELSFDRLSEQAASEDPAEDWGVHTEFDDQSNGGYGCIGQCRLIGRSLSVDLTKQLGRLRGVEGFDIELDLSDDQYQQVRSGLGRIFREMPQVLIIADASS